MLNQIQFMTIIKLLHVSAPGCHHQWVVFLCATELPEDGSPMHPLIHHLWHISTPTCVGTEVPSSGSHY